MAKHSWSELSPRLKAAIIVTGIVEAALLLAAQIDLARRPAALVAGSKTGWRLFSFVNVIGPIVYFLRGRRPRALSA